VGDEEKSVVGGEGLEGECEGEGEEIVVTHWVSIVGSGWWNEERNRKRKVGGEKYSTWFSLQIFHMQSDMYTSSIGKDFRYGGDDLCVGDIKIWLDQLARE